MAKDKLVVEPIRNGYAIGWFLVEDGELGAMLGESISGLTVPSQDEDRDWWASETAARALVPKPERDDNHGCFIWGTEGAAKKALREIKARMASLLGDKPWPEWALKAKAAGWSPPQGWKP